MAKTRPLAVNTTFLFLKFCDNGNYSIIDKTLAYLTLKRSESGSFLENSGIKYGAAMVI